MSLPINIPLLQMQPLWASQLNPVLANLLVQGQLLTGIKLLAGANTFNHQLGRTLVGWMVVGIDAASTVYDLQSTNPNKGLTLMLNSSAPCTANIWVF